MQRLFSSFPGGSPGVGLLVVRTAVGLVAIVETWRFMSVEPNNLMTVAAATIVLLSGVLLVVGFLTPGASSILGVAGVVLMTRGDLEAALVTANAAAVVLLGPGAFSIDARLFGRREILITPDRRES